MKKIKIFESVSICTTLRKSPFVEKYISVKDYIQPPDRSSEGGVSGRFVSAYHPCPYIWEWSKIKNEMLSILAGVGLPCFYTCLRISCISLLLVVSAN